MEYSLMIESSCIQFVLEYFVSNTTIPQLKDEHLEILEIQCHVLTWVRFDHMAWLRSCSVILCY